MEQMKKGEMGEDQGQSPEAHHGSARQMRRHIMFRD